jgi:hypothetical protein
MPRAIVLIKSDPEKWKETYDTLKKIEMSKEFIDKYNVIVECFSETFGWSDFVLFLYGRNVEQIKNSILELRGSSEEGENNAFFTSTLVTVIPEEHGKFDEKHINTGDDTISSPKRELLMEYAAMASKNLGKLIGTTDDKDFKNVLQKEVEANVQKKE